MSELDAPASGPIVRVFALVGQNDHLLVVEYPDHDALPGGAVRAGEPVEQALRRTVLDQLGATITEMDFCAVVEHGTVEPPASEVTVLFDVTLTDDDRLIDSAKPHRWANEDELSTLRPQPVRGALIAGTLSAEHPWRAWMP